jgi:hypothetical protein
MISSGGASHEARVHVTLGGARIATHAMFELPVPTPRCAGVARGGETSTHLSVSAPGLAASWHRAPHGAAPDRGARGCGRHGTGTAFLLVTLVPVPLTSRRRASTGRPVSLYTTAIISAACRGQMTRTATSSVPAALPWDARSKAEPDRIRFQRKTQQEISTITARWYDPNMVASRARSGDRRPYDPQGLSHSYVHNDPIGRVDRPAPGLNANVRRPGDRRLHRHVPGELIGAAP